ncbi:hypothetical protein ACSTS3_15680 [Aquimarina muelleri]|uniref:hypothetical protein n=1 Tax=Aquimarina muelleri TaxID=279356 RepID=UPI003F688B46
MRYFIYTLIFIAVSLIIYNTTHIDFENPLIKDSKTALIGVFSSSCVVVLLLILLISRSIQEKKRSK